MNEKQLMREKCTYIDESLYNQSFASFIANKINTVVSPFVLKLMFLSTWMA